METTTSVLILLLVWFLIALILGLTGRVSQIPFPLPQVVLFGLVVLQISLFGLLPGFKKWLFGLNLKHLVSVHLIRFVGIYFLILYSQDKLPYDFAVKGGIGDIIVALSALLLIIFVSSPAQKSKKIYLLWNTLGLIDIVFVVFTAGRIGMSSPQSIENLLKLPLSLLPTFIVPIIIFTHIIIFIRLYKKH